MLLAFVNQMCEEYRQNRKIGESWVMIYCHIFNHSSASTIFCVHLVEMDTYEIDTLFLDWRMPDPMKYLPLVMIIPQLLG